MFRPIPIPLGVERVDMEFIETKEQLEECIKELSKHSIIAIDLEAHSYRYTAQCTVHAAHTQI